MEKSNFLVTALLVIKLGAAAQAEQVPVKHIQYPMHRSMVVRSEAGRIIAHCEFSQAVQGDEVKMRLTYRFVDGSIDDETTDYTQQGTFRLVRDHHIQKGPFFTKPYDFSIEATSGMATFRTPDENGKVQIESKHIDLPYDLANGIVGTLLLNVPQNTQPFRVGLLAPVGGGRLIRIWISPEGEQSFCLAGQNVKAAVFRIHPELGGIVGLIAMIIGVQPKDVMVWVKEGRQPEVVRIVGQLACISHAPTIERESLRAKI